MHQLSLDQIITGLVGLGLIAKGIVDHQTGKKADLCQQSFECKADHAGLKAWMKLEFEMLNRRLDELRKGRD